MSGQRCDLHTKPAGGAESAARSPELCMCSRAAPRVKTRIPNTQTTKDTRESTGRRGRRVFGQTIPKQKLCRFLGAPPGWKVRPVNKRGHALRGARRVSMGRKANTGIKAGGMQAESAGVGFLCFLLK